MLPTIYIGNIYYFFSFWNMEKILIILITSSEQREDVEKSKNKSEVKLYKHPIDLLENYIIPV